MKKRKTFQLLYGTSKNTYIHVEVGSVVLLKLSNQYNLNKYHKVYKIIRFLFSGFLSFFVLSRVIVCIGHTQDLYLNTTDTNLSIWSIFLFNKLLSFTLFAVIDSAHISLTSQNKSKTVDAIFRKEECLSFNLYLAYYVYKNVLQI